MDENKGHMHVQNWLNLPNSSLDPPGRQLDLSSPTPHPQWGIEETMPGGGANLENSHLSFLAQNVNMACNFSSNILDLTYWYLVFQ